MKSPANLETLPKAWREAFLRDSLEAKPGLADPLPERRLARLLGAFIAAGLLFLVLPGTLLGVWNLLFIATRQQSHSASTAWIQAHGHAQLFGWVGTFILGISLYAVPKFRGAMPRSLALGWAMWGGWTAAVAARWLTAVYPFHWQIVWPAAGAIELGVAASLLWQCSASGASRPAAAAWEMPVFAGLAGLFLTMSWQLVLVLRPLLAPLIPAAADRLLISLALWAFCFPVVLGFGARLLPVFLGLAPASRGGIKTSLVALALAVAMGFAGFEAAAAAATLAAVIAACWALRLFHRTQRPPKLAGVDPRYPLFVRIAFVWLAVSALLMFGSASPGILGASRHAFTVGFLATMIFAIGPRILPSFLNSRELWSTRLMLASLVTLTAGCTLRVVSEPLAYGGVVASAWKALPVSAFIELSAVVLFAANMGKTLASPVPAWFKISQVKDTMTLYWYVTSYPATRKLLIKNGLNTLAHAKAVPKTLTLRAAAEADRADITLLLARLEEFFNTRLAKTVRRNWPEMAGPPRT